MSKPSLPPADYIQTDNQLRHIAQTWAKEPALAIDTESNSLYAYREQVCLFQVSTRTQDYIIDPLKIKDMTPLGVLLEDPRIEKVFHAAEYDLICIKRTYGFAVNNIFDTMVAARICGYPLFGLANMVESLYGIQMDKSHQRDDWGQRPLPATSLAYAQMDTHYLLGLRDDLYEKLTAGNRLAEAHEFFADLEQVQPNGTDFDPEGYWMLGRPGELNRRQRAILRELYLMRERIAELRDTPPFKILTNLTLVDLAKKAPQTEQELLAVKGITRTVARRDGKVILDAIEHGRTVKPPRRPARTDATPPEVTERYNALREWRKARAAQRGVESDVIISKATMWALARQAPQTPEALHGIAGLGPWRLEQYGDELLRVLQKR